MSIAGVLLLLAWGEESLESVLGRALAADREGRLEEAAASYREALRLEPEIPALHFNFSWVLVRQGRLTEALASVEDAVALDPDEPRFHLLRGRIFQDLESPERAAESFERAVHLAPNSREGYLALAELHQSRRELQAAATWLSRYLERRPDDVEALYFLGSVLSYGSELERAREALEKVLEVEPGHARAWFRWAHVQAQRPETMESALEGYRKSLELDGEKPYVWYEHGVLLDKLGRPRESVPAFERALELDPDFASATYALGNALSRTGRTDEARAQLLRFKALRDSEARAEAEAKRALAAFARGRKLLESHRLDEAIEAFLLMTELNPKAHQGYAFLAKAHFSRREVPVAIAYVRRAMALSPGSSEYPYLLSVFLRERGDPKAAHGALAAALALDPDNAVLHNVNGVLLEELGDLEASVVSLEKASTLDVDNPAYTLNLAMAYEKLGLNQKAERALRRYHEQLGMR